MTGIEIDTSEVRRAAADATRLPGELARWLLPAVNKGAVNIKKAMRSDLQASSNGGIRAVAATVSYDIHHDGPSIEAEVGPSKPAGALANIAYFGTSRGGGRTRDPREPLEEEAAAFEEAITSIVEDLWPA